MYWFTTCSQSRSIPTAEVYERHICPPSPDSDSTSDTVDTSVDILSASDMVKAIAFRPSIETLSGSMLKSDRSGLADWSIAHLCMMPGSSPSPLRSLSSSLLAFTRTPSAADDMNSSAARMNCCILSGDGMEALKRYPRRPLDAPLLVAVCFDDRVRKRKAR